jgi:hypothetical protein
VVHDHKDLQLFANDFCANAKDSVKDRLLFLNDIYTMEPSSDMFMDTCVSELKNSELMNPWYLPSIPTEILGFWDVC